jgi:cardiolipin synthase
LGVIQDQQEAAQLIARDIDQARYSVNAEFFALMGDGPGVPVFEALERAARRGVHVRLVVDGVGNLLLGLGTGSPKSWMLGRDMIKRLQQAGVEVTRAWRWSLQPAARHVDHRKVVAIDDTVGYVGGMNFGKTTAGWNDAMVRMTGGAAQALAGAQELRHQQLRPTPRMQSLKARTTPQPTRAVLLSNAPDQQQFEITDWYAKRIAEAKRRIWVTSPALLDRKVIQALKAAAERGVDVRVIVPGEGLKGIPFQYPMQKAVAAGVAEAGIRVREMRGFSHMKSMVVDDWATVGSFNLTNRSAQHDHELNVASADPNFVGQVERMFHGLERNSDERPPSLLTASVGKVIDGLGIQY